MNAKKIARIGVLAALMLVLGYIESLLPLPLPIPGIKLGLSNTVLLYAVYLVGIKEAVLLAALKVLLAGLLFGTPVSMLFSGAGAIVSLCGMVPLVRLSSNKVSPIGVSVAGALGHNAGQCAVACFVIAPKAVLAFVPFLLIGAVVTGAFTGMIAKYVMIYVKK